MAYLGDDLLTSAEAARLAGVGPTAVKRWADSGVLPCVRTAGGHRRFRRADVQRLVGRGRVVRDDWDEWLELLVDAPDVHLVQARLLEERAGLGSWHAVASGLGGLVTEIGRRWEGGRLSVLDEHLASGRLQRALAVVADALPLGPVAPVALLASVEQDEHTVGLSLVELTLREAGWRTEWAGSRTPATAIASRVSRGGLAMVAVSASAWSGDGAALESALETIGQACRDRRVSLALGGTGAWPVAPSYGSRFTDLEGFYAFAVAARDEPAEA